MTFTVFLELTDISPATDSRLAQRHSSGSGRDSSDSSDTYTLDYRSLEDIKSGYIRDVVESSYIDRNQHNEVVVAIPSRYEASLERYAYWLEDRKLVIDSAKQLTEDLQLAGYLDDNSYSSAIIGLLSQQVLGLKDLLLVKVDDLQLDSLILQLPYNYLPDAYKRDMDFRNRWMGKRNRTITIGGADYHINEEHHVQLKRKLNSVVELRNWATKLFGKQEGLSVHFWAVEGYPISQLSYYIYGKPEGIGHRFDTSGRIKEMTAYHHGYHHGLSIHFGAAGYIDSVEYYLHGQLVNRIVTPNWTRPFDLSTALAKIGCSRLLDWWQPYIEAAQHDPELIDNKLYSYDSLRYTDTICGST